MDTAFARVEDVLVRHFYQPDVEAARVLYSAFAAHGLSGPPVWPMIVAPPGTSKTETLNALDGQKGVHFIDQITPHTFISGQVADGKSASKVPPGLLHRIGSEGVIVFSDFSTVTAMPPDKRLGVLADMRRIYDGKLYKEFGHASKPGSRKWEGRITFLVAATPDVDRQYSIFQSLGERFVMVRCDRAGGTSAALAAMRQNPKEARTELKRAVQNLLAGVPRIEPQLPDGIANKIASLAELVVLARTHVQREGYQKKIESVPHAESPTRLAQQLAQLAKGSALLGHRREVTDEDYLLVRRVGIDCIPEMRAKIMKYLRTGEESNLVGLAGSTRTYAQEELQLLGLISRGSRLELTPQTLQLMSSADWGEEANTYKSHSERKAMDSDIHLGDPDFYI